MKTIAFSTFAASDYLSMMAYINKQKKEGYKIDTTYEDGYPSGIYFIKVYEE
jgi:hypothetical protein